jgi:hypothetical protein
MSAPQDESYPAYCRERAAECRKRANRTVVSDLKAAAEFTAGQPLDCSSFNIPSTFPTDSALIKGHVIASTGGTGIRPNCKNVTTSIFGGPAVALRAVSD